MTSLMRLRRSGGYMTVLSSERATGSSRVSGSHLNKVMLKHGDFQPVIPLTQCLTVHSVPLRV